MRVAYFVGSWEVYVVLFFKRTLRHDDFRFINNVKINVTTTLKVKILGELVFK